MTGLFPSERQPPYVQGCCEAGSKAARTRGEQHEKQDGRPVDVLHTFTEHGGVPTHAVHSLADKQSTPAQEFESVATTQTRRALTRQRIPLFPTTSISNRHHSSRKEWGPRMTTVLHA